MILSPRAIAWLNNNRQTRTRIAIALEAHPVSVDRWVRQNNRNLTQVDSLAIIQQDSGMAYSDLLVQDEPPILNHEMR